MKLLDRYVLSLFIKNYLISLTVLIGMYVVMDMVLRFGDIVSVGKQTGDTGLLALFTTLYDVGGFYFYQCFAIFTQLSGIIPVVATAFTLMRLSRFNELTAFVSAGVPMQRLVVPIIIAAIAINGLLIVDQEFILPGMATKLIRSHSEMHQSAGLDFPITSMRIDEHSVLACAMYDPTRKTMRDIDVIVRDENFVPTGHLRAATAHWNSVSAEWDLENGKYVGSNGPGRIASIEQDVNVYNGAVTPDTIDLYRGSAMVDYLPTSKLDELIHHPESYGKAGLSKIKNLRVTQPFMNIVLLILSMPAVLTFDPKTLKTAASKCLTLIGLAMTCVFVCQQIAGKPPLGAGWIDLWPALMSWLPIFIFGPIAIWLLLDRVRT